MNLIAFSMKTKGLHNFARRLWTVFVRFGFSEPPVRRALYAIIATLQQYEAVPTFFIPAVVLRRHRRLLAELVRDGTEIGVHGYVHNEYRFLSKSQQFEQTKQAISIFRDLQIKTRWTAGNCIPSKSLIIPTSSKKAKTRRASLPHSIRASRLFLPPHRGPVPPAYHLGRRVAN